MKNWPCPKDIWTLSCFMEVSRSHLRARLFMWSGSFPQENQSCDWVWGEGLGYVWSGNLGTKSHPPCGQSVNQTSLWNEVLTKTLDMEARVQFLVGSTCGYCHPLIPEWHCTGGQECLRGHFLTPFGGFGICSLSLVRNRDPKCTRFRCIFGVFQYLEWCWGPPNGSWRSKVAVGSSPNSAIGPPHGWRGTTGAVLVIQRAVPLMP